MNKTKSKKQPWKVTKEKSYSFKDVVKYPLKFSQGILGAMVDTAAGMVSKDGKTRYIHMSTAGVLVIAKNLLNLAPVETKYWVVFKSDDNKVTVIEFTKPEITGE
jgi:hypothetical protein